MILYAAYGILKLRDNLRSRVKRGVTPSCELSCQDDATVPAQIRRPKYNALQAEQRGQEERARAGMTVLLSRLSPRWGGAGWLRRRLLPARVPFRPGGASSVGLDRSSRIR